MDWIDVYKIRADNDGHPIRAKEIAIQLVIDRIGSPHGRESGLRSELVWSMARKLSFGDLEKLAAIVNMRSMRGEGGDV
jgi:hypothetical protein